MEIIHDLQNNMFRTKVDGYTAYVTYIVDNDKLDIRHTVVPPQIGGRGIAAQLVKCTYDYALKENLQPIATCSYAVVWLQRHPEYHGQPGKDYEGRDSCPLLLTLFFSPSTLFSSLILTISMIPFNTVNITAV